MNNKTSTIIAVVLILVSFAAGIYFYPQLPDKMASHWNAQGEVDGYMSKFWAMFLFPLVAAGILLMFWIIRKIDPLRNNIEKFKKYFNILMIMLVAFFVFVYALTLAWNLGYEVNFQIFLFPAIGVLFFYIGVLMKHAKRNWFVGIRTPWTLSSDKVWDETHRVGGDLFKISGIITITGLFFPAQAIYLILIPILASTIFVVVYSYLLYRKESLKN